VKLSLRTNRGARRLALKARPALSVLLSPQFAFFADCRRLLQRGNLGSRSEGQNSWRFLRGHGRLVPVISIISMLHAPAKPLPIIVSGIMILSYSSARTLPEAMAASLSVVPSAAAFSAMNAAFW
jgi:hypothetical protein